MFTIVDFLIALTFICVVMALVVWSRLKPDAKPDKQESEVRARRAAAFFAQAGHWASSAVNVVIGVLLGVAINGLVKLMFTGAWAAVFNIAVLSAVLFFIVFLHDRLGKKLFPSGIRPACGSEEERKTSLVRRLSLPAGVVCGVFFTSLGLGDYLSVWLF
ncbi:hypothetical protein J3362_01755 [Marinobacter sp. NFXS11]|uniref:hypothetical protein n=1 Tax=Marinobacter sp. NFXS11 TaxID=2818432 RepID=UPI0032DFDF41